MNIFLKRLIISFGFITFIICLVSCKSNNKVRECEYLDNSMNVTEIREGSILKYTTSAIFGNSNENVELLSYSEDTTFDDLENVIILDYEVEVDIDSLQVVLSITYEEDGREFIDTTNGVVMYNEQDSLDVLLDLDGEYIFVSELLSEFENIDEVGWFSRTVRVILYIWINQLKIANSAQEAVAYVEPAIRLCFYVTGKLDYILLDHIQNELYLENYNHNLELVNSYYEKENDFVYGQKYFTDWKFSFHSLAFSGCEIIAGYNLCHALYLNNKEKEENNQEYDLNYERFNINLAETILAYQELGIEVNSVYGAFGSNPYQIKYFLEAMNITCEGGAWNRPYVKSYDEFERLMNDNNDYYIIMSCWNQKHVGSLHTFMIDKNIDTKKSKIYYYGYNVDAQYDDEIYQYVKFTDSNNWILNFSVPNYAKETFICAYFIKK